MRRFVVVAEEAASCALLGEARWVRDRADPAQAEMAIAVADTWQGRGVADQLMAPLLSSACGAGISRLVANVRYDNEQVQGFLHRHDFEAAAAEGDDDLRLLRALGPQGWPAGARRARTLTASSA
ncbi:MAG: GNAT family N-acetyltransferase [Proteobacteria bacterium]|nr:GNAT family N-acetyltransferase [Pseudomonadota bacterium]